MPEHILVSDVVEGVARLTLNRPDKKNALSIALRDEVSDALDALAADESVKVVVVTGADTVFSAGFDLGEFQAAAGEQALFDRLWASSDRFHQTCIHFPLPMVAAVNGPAIAGGFDLATMCDIRIASERAYFSHPEIAFGGVIYSLLHDLVGGSVARDLVLTGRRIEADEALRLGVVTRVTAPEDLEAAVAEYTRSIVQASRENLMATKAKIVRRAGIAQGGTLEL